MPVKEDTVSVLVLETNAAVRAALTGTGLGKQAQLVFGDSEDPAQWIKQNFAAVVADEALFQSGREEPLIHLIKREMECPIIYMTVSSSRRIESMAREAGIAVVLRKPFGAGEFRRALGQVLQRDIPSDAAASNGATPGDKRSAMASTNGQQEISTIAEHVAPDSVFDHLFEELERRQPLQEGLDAFDVVEKQLIRRALEACQGNQSQAARFLGITRNTLRKRIHKYGLAALTLRDEQTSE